MGSIFISAMYEHHCLYLVHYSLCPGSGQDGVWRMFAVARRGMARTLRLFYITSHHAQGAGVLSGRVPRGENFVPPVLLSSLPGEGGVSEQHRV